MRLHLAMIVMTASIYVIFGHGAAPASEVIAYHVLPSTNGGASFNFVSGMRFNLSSPIQVTQLGMFDDPTNGPGFNSQPIDTPIKVSIWDRDTETIISQLLFGAGTGDGTLAPGTASRFKPLAAPMLLNPNSFGYIITNDYNFEQYGRHPDPNTGKTWYTNSNDGVIKFHLPGNFPDSPNQYAVAHDVFPLANDTAAVSDRYAAATFMFTSDAPPPDDTIAFYVPAGTDGTPTFNFVGGMRFTVNSPINVTELGMFDDPTNGDGFNSQPVDTPIKVSIWDRDTQSLLTQVLFGAGTGDGTLEAGTASRFKSLDTPLVLSPNTEGYIITSDYNFEEYGRYLDNFKTWETRDGGGLISFHPPGNFPDSPNQYAVAHDVFPLANDNEYVSDRYAAATFKFVAALSANNADFNGDGTVDAADYVVWRKNLGLMGAATQSQGDANSDQDVTSADYDVWRSQFGTSPAAASSAAAPEPSGLLLLLIGVVAIGGRRTNSIHRTSSFVRGGLMHH